MNLVLSEYEQGSEEQSNLNAELGTQYGVKNMGIWLTESDLAEMQQFCQEDSFGIGADNCLSMISMISTSAMSYCDANCVGAVDGKLFFPERNVGGEF